MSILHQAARRLERLEALDKVARPLAGAVGRAVRPRLLVGEPWPRGARRCAQCGGGHGCLYGQRSGYLAQL